MSKKKQNIEVNLIESTDSNGNAVVTLKVGPEVIGEIKTVDDKLEASYRHKAKFSVKSVEEGIQQVISEYHLHK